MSKTTDKAAENPSIDRVQHMGAAASEPVADQLRIDNELASAKAGFDSAVERRNACAAALRDADKSVDTAITRLDAAKRAAAALIPVDRSSITLTDGSPVTDDHRDLKPNGQQKGYVVLSEEERRRGFVRPVRDTYVHEKCGVATTMGRALAETYARDPKFYSGTFCAGCGTHFPVGPDGEFVWDDGSKVGT